MCIVNNTNTARLDESPALAGRALERRFSVYYRLTCRRADLLAPELVMADRRVELKGRKDDTLVLLVSRKGKSENSGNIGSPDGAAHD